MINFMEKLSLDRKKIPLYVQLEQIIKSQIIIGEFLPGDQIPTEKEIASSYQVSTITARQAILNLVEEGLLLRIQGKGTFVQKGMPDIKNIMTLNIKGNIHDILPEGITYQKVNVLHMNRIRASKIHANSLNLPEGHELLLICRTRGENGVLFSYIKNYLPMEYGKDIRKEDLLSFPMLHVLRNKLNIPLGKGIQHISAIVANYEIAFALSISISSPLLYVETTIYNREEKPIEFVQTFYRPDQFRYTLTLDMEGNETAL
jgi:GntR family transcriptional regulator